MSRIQILLFLFIISGCALQNGKKESIINQEDIHLVDYLFEGAKGDLPGANVLVIKNGDILLQKSYGMADVENGIKSHPETNYRIASVAKQFTAAGIMILEHQGKLTYETTLDEIFDDFPSYGETINVRNLLTHQSGVMDYDDYITDEQSEQLLDKDVFNILQSVDSTYFSPGTEYRYSNSGYAMLAMVIEKVSGISFAEFLDKEIFKKLGMDETEVFVLNDQIEHRAFGYSIENDSVVFNDQSVTSAIQGDGGIYSNVLDYYKWDQALYTSELIPIEKMEEAFYDWDGNKKTDTEGYGYGWSIDYINGIKIIEHLGGTAGFETWVRRVPSLGLSMVIFTNRDGHDRHLMHRINALTSIYSAYKIPMPIEILMKKEIDQRGVNFGIEIYDEQKNNPRYEYNETTPNFLGFEYFRMDKFETAEAIFIKDIEEQPSHFGGYFGLARVYKERNEVDKAILNFNKVIELGAPGVEWIVDRSKKEVKELMAKRNDSKQD